MLRFLDPFDAVAFPTSAMIFFGVCLFVEKNAKARFTRPLLDEDEDVVALVLLAHPYPVRKVVAVDAEFCAAENMVDDDDVTMMMKKFGRQKE